MVIQFVMAALTVSGPVLLLLGDFVGDFPLFFLPPPLATPSTLLREAGGGMGGGVILNDPEGGTGCLGGGSGGGVSGAMPPTPELRLDTEDRFLDGRGGGVLPLLSGMPAGVGRMGGRRGGMGAVESMIADRGREEA